MAKFYGKIGYAVRMEIRPGVSDDEITEREYFGDLLRNTSLSLIHISEPTRP